jgi:hypothetical protein
MQKRCPGCFGRTNSNNYSKRGKMKIEDQVINFEQAKRLLELGVNTNSLFKFFTSGNDAPRLSINLYEAYSLDELQEGVTNDVFIAQAYTVAELGVLLGRYSVVRVGDDDFEYWAIINLDNAMDIVYLSQYFDDASEAQARAEALIWLIENGFVKVEDLKL